jgi:Amt family ammonium transporter
MAEATGRIVPLEEEVLRQACRDFSRWRAAYPEAAGLTMSVNLSARHLQAPGLVADVQGLIRECAIPPSSLKLEITETSLMFGKTAALHTMDGLRAAGIRLVVDDFGTGYSSLAYLNRLPLDELKIDIQFVRDLEVRQDSREIVKAIIGMAGGLGLAVVAEGVETEGQRDILIRLGCPAAQGFLMSRPLPREEIEARFFGAA